LAQKAERIDLAAVASKIALEAHKPMTRQALINQLRWQLLDEQVLRALLACPDCGGHIPSGVAFRLAEDCISLDQWDQPSRCLFRQERSCADHFHWR
jgi:hypothetical protein